jgi:hypothetical protein
VTVWKQLKDQDEDAYKTPKFYPNHLEKDYIKYDHLHEALA